MALRLEQKKAIVAEVAEKASAALSIVVTDYRGLSSAVMTALRAKARQEGVYVRVVRNTLARRALADTPYACLEPALTGTTLLVFADEEPSATARLVRDFSKDHEALQVKALSLGGQWLDKTQLHVVANLPTRDEALAKLLAVMQAPITKFVRTLAEPHAKFVRLLAAVRDKKQSEAT